MSGTLIRMRARSSVANPNGAFTSILCNAVLTHVFVAGSSYIPSPTIYVGLFTQAPTVDGGGIEVTGDPNYVRMPIPFGPPVGPPYTTENSNEVDFMVASVDWGFIAAGGLFDMASGGSLLSFGLLLGTDGVTPIPRLVQAGDIFVIPAAGISVGLGLMAAIYGTRQYGISLYSADVTFETPCVAQSASSVAFRAGVRISGLFNIVSQSLMTATGRLYWTPIPAGPCENTWTSLVRNPCCVVCNP